MRTTVTLDDDVAALIEGERARTGESFREALNRLLRRSARSSPAGRTRGLPERPGRPTVDLSDVSSLLATLEDESSARLDPT